MMRYHIFLVEDDVYFDYFYKTQVLHQFFMEYMAEPNRADLKKQFSYVTCPIPHDEMDNNNQNIYLSERIITVFVEHELILDNYFITQLEKTDRHCFIINHTQSSYGWLRPNKSELLWPNQIQSAGIN